MNYRPLLLLLLSFCLHAEQKQDFGPYSVHYQALPTTFLTPAIAGQYPIRRSRYEGLVTVTVLDSRHGNRAIRAVLDGTATNRVGNQRRLSFREVIEGDAIYYLATLPVSHQEHFVFAITLRPAGGPPLALRFDHRFYTD